MKIYEIRDETDDDRYYSLGLFETLDAAKQEIIETPSDRRISDTDDDYEKYVSTSESLDGMAREN